MHSAKIVCDSISPRGTRLTSLELVFPRCILAEVNTHTVLTKNSASSRAIPVEKMLRRVQDNPYVPSHWGINQSGMQAEKELPEHMRPVAEDAWLEARDNAVNSVRKLLNVGDVYGKESYEVHKQITNRLLEPFMWHTALITGTEWNNFFNLRCHKDAHPDFIKVAKLAYRALQESEPQQLEYGVWHLPYIRPEEHDEFSTDELIKLSVARCARVSYLTQDGIRNPQKDLDLHHRLLTSGHMSPFGHIGRPMHPDEQDDWLATAHEGSVENTWSGNFRGWVQYRKTIPGEFDIKATRGEGYLGE
jgi:hypothetical protein